MSNHQTDSSYFFDKIALRCNHLPDKDPLRVLDVFGGNGRIWAEVTRQTGRSIDLVRIDKKRDRNGFYLQGDNKKFMSRMDLSAFQVIDLDAYGVPFAQLKVLFNFQKNKPMNCVVFVTFIQAYQGQLPHGMLNELGYSNKMIKKIPTLFFRDGWQKMSDYLALHDIDTLFYRGDSRKHYFCFKITNNNQL